MLTGEVPKGTLIKVTYRASEYVKERTFIGEVQRCSFEDFEGIPRVWYYETIYWDSHMGGLYTDNVSTYVAEDISISDKPIRLSDKRVSATKLAPGTLVINPGSNEIMLFGEEFYRGHHYTLNDRYGEQYCASPEETFYVVEGLLAA